MEKNKDSRLGHLMPFHDSVVNICKQLNALLVSQFNNGSHHRVVIRLATLLGRVNNYLKIILKIL